MARTASRQLGCPHDRHDCSSYHRRRGRRNFATIAADGTVLDTWFPAPELSAEPGPSGTERLTAERAAELLGGGATAALGQDSRRGVEVVAVRTVISSLDEKPIDTHDAYLRLHLLSHRLVKPHGQSLDGVFGLLVNVAWTSLGPVAVDDIEKVRLNARAEGLHLQVTSVDKFPRMTDYVAPKGVRIADADRVRLGAHLAEGTTVMHEGFVNFNAGTLGTSMVEGRISAWLSSSATARTSAAAPPPWAPCPAAATSSSPSASAA